MYKAAGFSDTGINKQEISLQKKKCNNSKSKRKQNAATQNVNYDRAQFAFISKVFLTSQFFHCPNSCSHKSMINDSNRLCEATQDTIEKLSPDRTGTTSDSRIITLCSRDTFQQVAVIQLMQDTSFLFRFYKAQ
jgi:hypothetical protein